MSEADSFDLVNVSSAKRFNKKEGVYFCKCNNYLTDQENLESDAYQGESRRSGKAALFTSVINITCGEPEEKTLMTGLHVVRDIFCDKCQEKIGWTYDKAYESDQKFKEGKFIVERAFVRKLYTSEDADDEADELSAEQVHTMIADLKRLSTRFSGARSEKSTPSAP